MTTLCGAAGATSFCIRRKGDGHVLGSGFPVDGQLFTSLHVVLEVSADDLVATAPDGREYMVSEVSLCEEDQVARLSVDSSLPVLFFATAIQGEAVRIHGYPQSPVPARSLVPLRICTASVMALIQTNRGLRIELQGGLPRGFSGSPVFNIAGAIVGMVESMEYAPYSLESLAVGFGYVHAIPTSRLISA